MSYLDDKKATKINRTAKCTPILTHRNRFAGSFSKTKNPHLVMMLFNGPFLIDGRISLDN